MQKDHTTRLENRVMPHGAKYAFTCVFPNTIHCVEPSLNLHVTVIQTASISFFLVTYICTFTVYQFYSCL